MYKEFRYRDIALAENSWLKKFQRFMEEEDSIYTIIAATYISSMHDQAFRCGKFQVMGMVLGEDMV